MKSKTSLVARQYRLQQWADQIRECQSRSHDMTIKEWCSQHELTTANYYYRLKEVRKACLEQHPEDIVPQSIIPISAELMSNECTTAIPSTLEVSINGISINVNKDTSPELLKMVLQVAAHVK